ncbi:MAG: hypothetical protein HRU20_31725 [Pseudomonadales bacterium]|nr:hypothetical protein [Pseudomonadales bacterium]
MGFKIFGSDSKSSTTNTYDNSENAQVSAGADAVNAADFAAITMDKSLTQISTHDGAFDVVADGVSEALGVGSKSLDFGQDALVNVLGFGSRLADDAINVSTKAVASNQATTANAMAMLGAATKTDKAESSELMKFAIGGAVIIAGMIFMGRKK